jgi:hypothetical protein
MSMGRIPIQLQGPGFEPFLKLSFSFINEMDEDKIPKVNKVYIVIWGTTMLPNETRLKFP